MSYSDRLRSEIAAKVDSMAAKDEYLHPTWVAHEICNDHQPGLADNEHAEFWRHGGYLNTRKETGAYITKHYGGAATESDDRQMVLAGFDYVQTHYLVKRNGDEIAIPVTEMTSDERTSWVMRLRATGNAYHAHADELERFGFLYPRNEAAE